MKKLDSSILIILAIIVSTYFTAGIVKILLGIATDEWNAARPGRGRTPAAPNTCASL